MIVYVELGRDPLRPRGLVAEHVTSASLGVLRRIRATQPDALVTFTHARPHLVAVPLGRCQVRAGDIRNVRPAMTG
ncbi:hypothetical protein [Dactylosporangium sp. CS-033363]|uniref:hypothetical protein n=1 Tax=Dactylosporangium sp. CS-033363 TaxID=3239935 RepID=UPI003D8F3963